MQPKSLSGAALVFASCLWLAGCAGLSGADDKAPAFRDPAMSVETARDTLIIGTSSKADVLAALGSATVVQFDSGFEVWVYRAKAPRAASTRPELVILFTPSGIVKKIRIRPSYDAPQA